MQDEIYIDRAGLGVKAADRVDAADRTPGLRRLDLKADGKVGHSPLRWRGSGNPAGDTDHRWERPRDLAQAHLDPLHVAHVVLSREHAVGVLDLFGHRSLSAPAEGLISGNCRWLETGQHPTWLRPYCRAHSAMQYEEDSFRSFGVPMTDRLRAEGLTLKYDARIISEGLSVSVPDGAFTAVVGPNACGKSTLLRALARLLPPEAGQVVLDGKAISQIPSREVARNLGLLPQQPIAPDGITVADLVARGRFPHQSFLRQWSPQDEAAVERALKQTGTSDLADRPLTDLSGGQRQRVWVAMALAQDTPILLLDEPTTFLDIVHQVELLEMLVQLNREGRTIVAVLHELNLAFRYAGHLVAMRDGAVVATGTPDDIVSAALMREVFGLDALVMPDPLTDRPMVIPRGPA